MSLIANPISYAQTLGQYWTAGQSFRERAQAAYHRYREARWQDTINNFGGPAIKRPKLEAPPVPVSLQPAAPIIVMPRYPRRSYMAPSTYALRVGRRYYGARRVFRRGRGYYQRQGRFSTFNKFRPEHMFNNESIADLMSGAPIIPTGGNDIVKVGLGDGASSRTGRKICVDKVWIKGSIYTDGASGASVDTTNFYLYLVQDTQCNGAAATVMSSSVGSTAIWTGSNLATCFRNPYTFERFKILAFKKYSKKLTGLWDGTGQQFMDTSFPVSFGWKAKPGRAIEIDYSTSSTDGSLGTRVANNIFLVWGTDGSNDGVWEGTLEAQANYYDCH